MPAKLVVAPEAELDIEESYRRQPEMYPRVHETYRRSLIRRFAETTVTVYSVFHTSRDPDKWRRRLPLIRCCTTLARPIARTDECDR